MLDDYFEVFTYKKNTSDGWANSLGNSVDCTGFIQPIGGSESFSHLNLTTSVTARLYCDITVDLSHGDEVTHDGRTYTVLYATQPQGISGMDHHKEVLLGDVE